MFPIANLGKIERPLSISEINTNSEGWKNVCMVSVDVVTLYF